MRSTYRLTPGRGGMDLAAPMAQREKRGISRVAVAGGNNSDCQHWRGKNGNVEVSVRLQMVAIDSYRHAVWLQPKVYSEKERLMLVGLNQLAPSRTNACQGRMRSNSGD